MLHGDFLLGHDRRLQGLQFIPLAPNLLFLLNRFLEGRHQQVEDLLFPGRDKMPLAAQIDFEFTLNFGLPAQIAISQQVIDTVDQHIFVIQFPN